MEFEGSYCFDTASVRFAVYPDGPEGPRVVAHISQGTLHDAFGTKEVGHGLLEACERHFDALEAAVAARLRTDPQWPLMITIDDFPRSALCPWACRSDALSA